MSRRNHITTKSLETVRMFLQTMITLASASLGLVAALAWNEAIKTHVQQIMGEGKSLSALYTYAVVATVIAVVVVGTLGWLAAKIGGEAAIKREAEG